jgi:peptidoglycan/xylan/chitin deacetylase (PgdA/CDA1 family)
MGPGKCLVEVIRRAFEHKNCGWGEFLSARRNLSCRIIDMLRILCLHRVVGACSQSDWPWRMRGTVLEAEELKRSLSRIESQYRFVDEGEATRIAKGICTDNTKPEQQKPACWVTFDDGYRDNLEFAAPIMKEFGINPTLFVTTAILQSGWRLPVDRWYGVCLSSQSVRKRELLSTSGFREKIVKGQEKRAFVEADSGQQERLIEQMAMDWQGNSCHSYPEYLDLHDLERLAGLGWKIGPHGHHHQLLSFCSPEDISREVLESHQVLKQAGLATSRWFAYPDGAFNRFVQQKVCDVLTPLGYQGALTVESRDVHGTDHLWSIPRRILSPSRLNQLLE